MVTRSQILYINSANRVSGSINDFQVAIPHGHIKVEKLGKIKLTILDAVVNRSWYTVNSTNNTFLMIKLNSPSETTTITIPEGYYSVSTLRSTLNAYMPNWSIQYSTRTNKYTFIPPDNANTYELRFTGKCGPLLGFDTPSRNIGTFSSPIVSTRPVKVNAENAVLIHCNIPKLKHAVVDNLLTTEFAESDILVKVPIDVPPFDNVVYTANSTDLFSFYTSAQHINNIRFWVTDENNNSLSLQYDWTLTLKIEYHEGAEAQDLINDNVEKIRDYIKLMILSDQKISK